MIDSTVCGEITLCIFCQFSISGVCIPQVLRPDIDCSEQTNEHCWFKVSLPFYTKVHNISCLTLPCL